MKSDRDFQAAMRLLSCLYGSLVQRLLSCYYPLSAVITSSVRTPTEYTGSNGSIGSTDAGVLVEGTSQEGVIDSGTKGKWKNEDHDKSAQHEITNDENEEKHIVTALLIDMKRNVAKKLYRFALSAGGKGSNQPPKEEWKVAYTKEDIAFIVKTDAFDAIQRLVLSSGY